MGNTKRECHYETIEKKMKGMNYTELARKLNLSVEICAPLWFRTFPPSLPTYVHYPVLPYVSFFLLYPLWSLQKEVSETVLTVLYGPVILQGSVWRDCWTKDRHAERIFSVKAHCTGGIQFNSVSSQLLLKQKYKTHNKMFLQICPMGVFNWATAVWS